MMIGFLQYLDGTCHHFPVVAFAHQLAVGRGSFVELDAGVEHRSIHHILLNLLCRQVQACLLSALEVAHGVLIYLIIGSYPSSQPYFGTSGELNLHRLAVFGRQAIYGNESRAAACTTASTYHIYALSCCHLLIICRAHNARLAKFWRRYAKCIAVIFHNYNLSLFFTGEIIPVSTHTDAYRETYDDCNQIPSNIHNSILQL